MTYLAGAALAPYLGSLVWQAGGYGLMLSLGAEMAFAGCGVHLIAHHLARRAGRVGPAPA